MNKLFIVVLTAAVAVWLVALGITALAVPTGILMLMVGVSVAVAVLLLRTVQQSQEAGR